MPDKRGSWYSGGIQAVFFMKFILSAFLSPRVQTEDPEHCCVEAQPEEVSARELNCRTTSWLGRAGELLLVSNKTKQNKTNNKKKNTARLWLRAQPCASRGQGPPSLKTCIRGNSCHGSVGTNLSSMRTWVQSLSGLRIWCCCGCGVIDRQL